MVSSLGWMLEWSCKSSPKTLYDRPYFLDKLYNMFCPDYKLPMHTALVHNFVLVAYLFQTWCMS